MASNVNRTLDDIKAIPRDRLARKIGKSAFGLLFIAGAVAAAWKLAWPWYVVLPVAVFGAHIASAELTTSAAKFVVAVLKDTLAAVKSLKNGAAK